MSVDINTFMGHIDIYLKNWADDYTIQHLTPFFTISSVAATVLSSNCVEGGGSREIQVNPVIRCLG